MNFKGYAKVKTLTLSLALGSLALTVVGCNSSVSQFEAANKLTDTQLKGLDLQAIQASNDFTFNLGNQDLVSEPGKYKYSLVYLDNVNLPREASGDFNCLNSRNCRISIKTPTEFGLYALEVYKDGKFIGAGTFNYTNLKDIRYYPGFAINPNTTGIYLLKLLSIKMSNPTEMSILPFDQADDRVRVAMQNLNINNYNIYEVSYYYFNYLMQKGLSFDEAFEQFSEHVNRGRIDPQFGLTKAMDDYRTYLETYNQLSNEAELEKANQAFKAVTTKLSNVVGTAGSIIGSVFPQAAGISKGAKQGMDYAGQIFDAISSLSGSKDALHSLQTLTENVRQQSAPDPDIKDITSKISTQIEEAQAQEQIKLFWDAMQFITSKSNELSNYFGGLDIDAFIKIQLEVEPRKTIDDLVKLYSRNNDKDGVFNTANLNKLSTNAALLANMDQLRYFTKRVREVGLDNSSEDNLILRRKAVNDRLGLYYLSIINALYEVYMIEKMALFLTQKSAYKNEFRLKISLPESLRGKTYDARLKSLTEIFQGYTKNVNEVFNTAVVNVYEGVPNYEELYAKDCDIRSLNAAKNTLRATCPVISSKGKVFKTSTLQFADKPNGEKTLCYANTVSANADGNLTCKLASLPKAARVFGPLFSYLDRQKMAGGDENDGVRYDDSGFIIGLPVGAKLTLGEANIMKVVDMPLLFPYEAKECNSRFITCHSYKYKERSTRNLGYPALFLKKSRVRPGNGAWKIGGDITQARIRYNGIDYPFSIKYYAETSGAGDHFYLFMDLGCTEAYPSCEVIDGDKLKFTTRNDFSTTIGVRWDDTKEGIHIPRLTINP